MEYLGETLDIHTGGEDHIFPHHENEIAQSEGATGKKFADFWLHARFLMVDGQKMSKSKGNFYALKDIEAKGYLPMHFRLFALSGHYRTNVNFTWAVMDQAKANYNRITDWISNLENLKIEKSVSLVPGEDKIDFSYIYQKRFEAAMDDDLNTPLALSVVYELITETNKLLAEKKLGQDEAKNILNLWQKMNKVFGLKIDNKTGLIPDDINKLAEERKKARDDKNFQLSDELREKMEKMGYSIEDLKDNEYIIRKK